MDERKKPIMIGVIVVSLVGAGIVYYMTKPEGSYLPSSYLMKCKECGAVYKVSREDYLDYVREHRDPGSDTLPAMVCEECDREDAFRAVKCKCGEVFFYNLDPDDYPDRCPECGFSKAEDKWKKKTAE